ncbi:MAG: hypothetical protein ACOY4U_11265 [Pseudomonadota bacterium]
MAKLHIKSQGHFDGACFLYSIANAYGALKGRNFPDKDWDRRVVTLPFMSEFMTTRGTTLYNDELPLYTFAISRLLNKYDDGPFVIEPITNISSGKTLANSINETSVLIVNIESEHWVCAVDKKLEDGLLFVACSSQLLELRSRYFESKSQNYGRLYNRELSISNGKVDWLHANMAIRVSLP